MRNKVIATSRHEVTALISKDRILQKLFKKMYEQTVK